MKSERDDLDSVDLEHLRQTVETHGWQMIRERIERCEADTLRQLGENLNQDETAFKRGFRRGLLWALSVPELVRKDIAGGRKK